MKFCLDVNPYDERKVVISRECHKEQKNQYFRYDTDTLQIRHGPHNRQDCLDIDLGSQNVFVTKCNETKTSQKWKWGFVDESKVHNWLSFGDKIRNEQEIQDLKALGFVEA